MDKQICEFFKVPNCIHECDSVWKCLIHRSESHEQILPILSASAEINLDFQGLAHFNDKPQAFSCAFHFSNGTIQLQELDQNCRYLSENRKRNNPRTLLVQGHHVSTFKNSWWVKIFDGHLFLNLFHRNRGDQWHHYRSCNK